MPHVKDHPKKAKRLWILIGACFLVFIAVAGYAVFTAEQDAQAQHALNVALSVAKADDDRGDYTAEASVLKQYLATNPPKKYRYTVYLMLGNLAYDSRKDTEAEQDYKLAVGANGNKLTEIAAEDIGQAAASAGDKTTAIQYFHRAITLSQAQPGVSNDVDDLKATVKNLESTQ